MMDVEQVLTHILEHVRERRKISFKINSSRHYNENDLQCIERFLNERRQVLELFKKLDIKDPDNYDFRHPGAFLNALEKVHHRTMIDEEREMDIQDQAHGNGQNQALSDVAEWLKFKAEDLNETGPLDSMVRWLSHFVSNGGFLKELETYRAKAAQPTVKE